MSATEPTPTPRPYTLVAELTYRCPLRCAYCSNPVRYAAARGELTTAEWQAVFHEAEALGVVQLNLTGGEPLLRDDLEQLVHSAHELGLYVSMITSAVSLTEARLLELKRFGVEHVQFSIQGLTDADAERIARGAHLAQKLEAMRWVRQAGLALTLNVVLHRENIGQVSELIALAEHVGAERLELANTQFLGWALENRAALLPAREQIESARAIAAAARERLRGRMDVLFVLPDYHTDVVRPCMQGWARRYILVSPDGLVLPCHQAHTLPGLHWERATERPLAEIWRDSSGLNMFRGEGWLPDPCRSCERRTLDFGGCRCQAYYLTGRLDVTDPACGLAPDHGLVLQARQEATTRAAASGELVELRYRRTPRR